mmetsp:Transcript_854/g.3121  ORF Transcript_854/g.3121 Transcript_854/m.3121 type:complete len:263 (+) Transcript_854:2145-2933(+)
MEDTAKGQACLLRDAVRARHCVDGHAAEGVARVPGRIGRRPRSSHGGPRRGGSGTAAVRRRRLLRSVLRRRRGRARVGHRPLADERGGRRLRGTHLLRRHLHRRGGSARRRGACHGGRLVPGRSRLHLRGGCMCWRVALRGRYLWGRVRERLHHGRDTWRRRCDGSELCGGCLLRLLLRRSCRRVEARGNDRREHGHGRHLLRLLRLLHLLRLRLLRLGLLRRGTIGRLRAVGVGLRRPVLRERLRGVRPARHCWSLSLAGC